MTVREFQDKYKSGEFDFNFGRSTAEYAGWFEWHCPFFELEGRLAKLWEITGGITNDYILDNFRAGFKNMRLPKVPLYDTIWFYPLGDSNYRKLLFVVVIDNELSDSRYEVISDRHRQPYQSRFDKAEDVLRYINGALVEELRDSRT